MASPILTIKKGDTFPALENQLFQTIEGTQTPINLALSSAKADKPAQFKEVLLKMTLGTTKFTGKCTLVAAAGDAFAGESGHIKYTWPVNTAGELATIEGESNPKKANTFSAGAIAGTWKLEWEIIYATGVVQSVPNEGQDELIITPTI